MAKVKPSLLSDEDSAVELLRSTSESDVSPREDLFGDIDWMLNNFSGSESEFSDDGHEDVSSSAVSSSVTNSTKLRSASAKTSVVEKKKPARRGRKRSIEDDEDLLEKEMSRNAKKHQSKNAINARINRIKKKKYIQTLEDSLNAYKEECQKWQTVYKQRMSLVQSLRDEVKYLKTVIKKETELGKLVRHFNHHKNKHNPQPNIDAMMTAAPVSDKGSNISNLCNIPPVENSNDNVIESNLDPNLFVKASNENSNDCSELSNFDSNFLPNDLDLSMYEDISFKNVFPSACDLFNFDLPESEESDMPKSSLSSSDSMFSSDDDIGICLHLSASNQISMEFCSHCSKSASSEFPDLSMI